jgi:hypothetical protein
VVLRVWAREVRTNLGEDVIGDSVFTLFTIGRFLRTAIGYLNPRQLLQAKGELQYPTVIQASF